MVEHEITTKSRLLARLVRDLLATEKFESLADLTEALKCRCARLKIRWTPDDIGDAYRLIESNTALPGAPIKRVRRITHIERIEDDVRPITRAKAAELWPRLVAAVMREQQRRRSA
jgi:hypothetical protein